MKHFEIKLERFSKIPFLKSTSKISILLMLSFFLALKPTDSANAIFGLSKCEKVTKSIKSEERVGKYAWIKFDELRDSLVKNEKLYWRDWFGILNSYIPLGQSILKTYNLVVNNPDCFSPELVYDARIQVKSYNKFLKDSQAWLKDYPAKAIDYPSNSQVTLTVEKAIRKFGVNYYESILKK